MSILAPRWVGLVLLIGCGSPASEQDTTIDPITGYDAVLNWNAIGIEATNGTPPGLWVQSRSMAIMHIAMYDALNSITGQRPVYHANIPAPAGASVEAAVVAAAHRAMVTLHPEQASFLDAKLAESLAAIPNGQAKEDGIAVGVAAADAIVALRADDGAFSPIPYTPGSGPGVWVPTPPAFLPAAVPHWGSVTPFAMTSGSQFRPPPPPALTSSQYRGHYNEVKRVGDVDSTDRPQDRSDVAQFYTPGGTLFWHPAARQVSVAKGKSLSENARIFAQLSIAIADALIACWEAKYYYNFWRPVTAIPNGDLDGNKGTDPDPTWLAFIATPPFPSYPSGHGSVAGAAIAVLERHFGKGGHTIALTSPAKPGLTLNYGQFVQIGNDIDDARIYGGIHFRFDQLEGRNQGRQLGYFIFDNILQ